MANFSTGIDVISISRIRELSAEPLFLKRVFTEEELRYSSGKKASWRHLAGRFAAKEAVMKALGTGWGKGVEWKDIEVRVREGAPPEAYLFQEAGRLLGKNKIFLSISYSARFAAALAVIEAR